MLWCLQKCLKTILFHLFQSDLNDRMLIIETTDYIEICWDGFAPRLVSMFLIFLAQISCFKYHLSQTTDIIEDYSSTLLSPGSKRSELVVDQRESVVLTPKNVQVYSQVLQYINLCILFLQTMLLSQSFLVFISNSYFVHRH